jgi:hypothetical protein
MKHVFAIALLTVLCSSAWGQAAPAQNAAPQPQAAPMGHPMHHEMHHGMMQQHMQAMKAQLDTMRAKLADLKASLVKVKDPATKQALQADVDLWEAMANHMEGMQKMMAPAGPGAGMAMHHDGAGCPCCAEMMKHGTQDGKSCCCGGNKCTQGQPNTPGAAESAPPAN